MSEILLKRKRKRKDLSTGEDIELDFDGLYPRQRRFCEEYVKDFDIRAAAIRAGYKPSQHLSSTGSRILDNKYASAYIKEILERIRIQTEVDTIWVVRKAKTTAERCIPEPDDKVNQFNPHGAVAALKLLSGYTGGFDKNNPKDEGRSPTINIYSIEAREKVRGILENVRNLREIKPISIE